MDAGEQELYLNIGKVTRALAGLRGLTSSDVQRGLAMSRFTYSERMNAKSRWTPDEIQRLARLFGVSAGVFFEPASELVLRHPDGRLNSGWRSRDEVTHTPELAAA